jgi:hypothetical protein
LIGAKREWQEIQAKKKAAKLKKGTNKKDSEPILPVQYDYIHVNLNPWTRTFVGMSPEEMEDGGDYFLIASDKTIHYVNVQYDEESPSLKESETPVGAETVNQTETEVTEETGLDKPTRRPSLVSKLETTHPVGGESMDESFKSFGTEKPLNLSEDKQRNSEEDEEKSTSSKDSTSESERGDPKEAFVAEVSKNSKNITLPYTLDCSMYHKETRTITATSGAFTRSTRILAQSPSNLLHPRLEYALSRFFLRFTRPFSDNILEPPSTDR